MGKYSTDLTGTYCTECDAGTFADDTGATACEACPINTYADSPGTAVCEKCDEGYFSGLGSTKCTFCASTKSCVVMNSCGAET